MDSTQLSGECLATKTTRGIALAWQTSMPSTAAAIAQRTTAAFLGSTFARSRRGQPESLQGLNGLPHNGALANSFKSLVSPTYRCILIGCTTSTWGLTRCSPLCLRPRPLAPSFFVFLLCLFAFSVSLCRTRLLRCVYIDVVSLKDAYSVLCEREGG